jgi:Cu/Ag efflux pump CusA
VSIRPFYDRSELIDRTIDTLKHALVEEIILVTLAHIIFLWHFRSILIVTLPLPISILISFLLMKELRHHQQHHVARRHRHRHRRAGGCGDRGHGKCDPAL